MPLEWIRDAGFAWINIRENNWNIKSNIWTLRLACFKMCLLILSHCSVMSVSRHNTKKLGVMRLTKMRSCFLICTVITICQIFLLKYSNPVYFSVFETFYLDTKMLATTLKLNFWIVLPKIRWMCITVYIFLLCLFSM